MTTSIYTSIIYAILLAIGGVVGYVTKGSIASIGMGSASAAFVALTAWGMHHGYAIAHSLCMLLALLLVGFFGYRYALTGSFFPGGLMAICSFVVLAVLMSTKE